MYQVYSTLQTLPPKCGQVARMYYLKEKSLQEIATGLDLSLSTVKSQKGRAIELLRKKLPHLGWLHGSDLICITVVVGVSHQQL